MKFRNFIVEENGKKYILRKESVPRIEIILDLSNSLPFIKYINPIDDCTASQIAQVLRELESFIKSIQ